MSHVLVLLLRFIVAMAGYTAAVIVATLVSIFLMLLMGWRDGLISALQDLTVIAGVGLVLTFIMAFPGFCITLLLARAHGWRNWRPFTIAGGANALLSLLIYGTYDGTFGAQAGLAVFCVPGGFAGGLIYWLAAGRFLVRRQEVEAA